MDVLVLIDKLDDTVHNAKQVPLTDTVRVDKEEIYDILDQMRATIPEEIKQARWIVKERQEMLAEAKREATRSGTKPLISPPNIAISFTPLELRKLNSGAAIMNMLSMSGAIFRFSWFISNSYSKSEMARSPLTITFAPFSRAKSTRRVSKGFTCTFGYSATSDSINATRSSPLNTVLPLRTAWFTTPTMTLSKTFATRVMMSMWPNVTGS